MQAEKPTIIDGSILTSKRKVILIGFIVLLLLTGFFVRGKIYVVYLSIKASAATNGGNLKQAEKLYKKIISLEPNVAEHHWELGTVYISMNNEIELSRQIVKLKKMGRSDLVTTLRKISRAPVSF